MKMEPRENEKAPSQNGRPETIEKSDARKAADDLINHLNDKSGKGRGFRVWFINEYKPGNPFKYRTDPNRSFLENIAVKAEDHDWQYAVDGVFEEECRKIENLGDEERATEYNNLVKKFRSIMSFMQ